MSMKDSLKLIQLEADNRALILQIAGLKQIIAAANCAVCGEMLYDSEFDFAEEENGDEGPLCHSECVEKYND